MKEMCAERDSCLDGNRFGDGGGKEDIEPPYSCHRDSHRVR